MDTSNRDHAVIRFESLQMHPLGSSALKRNLFIHRDTDDDTISRNDNNVLRGRDKISCDNLACFFIDSMSNYPLATPRVERKVPRPATLTKAFLRNRKQSSLTKDGTHRHQTVTRAEPDTTHSTASPRGLSQALYSKPDTLPVLTY